jgi:predicted cupin superfamily sugar epimerase
MHDDVETLVRRLGLTAHPEGGFYRETFRAPLVLGGLPHGAPRSASTAIYFLLPAGAFSAFHRVRSDEVWHHYGGDPLALHVIGGDGALSTLRLGRNLAAGEAPQAVVLASSWQSAEPLGARFSLCGCTVAPGFDFADFELADRAGLTARFPGHEAIISRLTRS